MNKKIGFRSYAQEPDEEQEKKDDTRAKLLADFIAANYQPIGETENKVYKTSEELAYDMQELVAVRAQDIAEALTLAKYKLEYIGGKPYWMMFER